MYNYHWGVVLHICSVFENSKILENDTFNFFHFPIFDKFEGLRDLFDSHSQSAALDENQSVLYLKLYSRRRFPSTLIFTQISGTWRHSDVIYGQPIGSSYNSFGQDVQN